MILRGNSATGKTTLAAALQRALGRGTANIGQDHFRRVVLREHDVSNGDNVGLIENAVRYCLGIGYHVVLEGILLSVHYGQMLRELVQSHPGRSHVFYLDVPVEETLRRHDGRPLRAEVAPQKLREWYVPSDTLHIPGEIVLDGSDGMEATLTAMLGRIGPVRGRRERPEDDSCRLVPMPDRSRKRPTDLNALAASIVADATDEDKAEPVDDGKDPAAVSLGRKGGLKGGKARAAKLTPERRSEIARKAAAVRWES